MNNMKMGKLYLNYWSNLKKHSCANVFGVCWGKIAENNGFETLRGLRPDWKIIEDWKNCKIDWEEYRKQYITQFKRPDFENDILNLASLLNQGEDAMICCYEKEEPCHRFIIAEIFVKAGFEVYSWKGDTLIDLKSK